MSKHRSGSKTKKSKSADVIHAVSLPIVGPENPDDWPQLADELSHGFRVATDVSNWAMHEMFKRDEVLVGDGNTKLPPPPDSWKTIYADSVARWPELASSVRNPLLQAAHHKYAKFRYSLVRNFDKRMPKWRFPQPIPLKNGTYRIEWDGTSVWLRFRLVGLKRACGRTWRVRMKGGRDWHRQIREIREILAGDGEFLQAIIVARPKKGSSRSNGKFARPVMVRIVVRRPVRTGNVARPNVLLVRTMPDSLLVARVRGDARNCRHLHGDHIVRAIIAHDVQIDRLRSDQRCFDRRAGRRMDALTEKMKRCMDTWCKQTAAAISRWAVSRRCGLVIWDDSVRTFLPHFRWDNLETTVRHALTKARIECRTAAEIMAEAEVNKAQDEWLRLQADLEAMADKIKLEDNGDECGGRDDDAEQSR